jgi:hypothetical protein
MKGQSSVESLFNIAISLFIIALLSGISFISFNTVNENIEKSRAIAFLDKLYSNAYSVYIQGPNASKTLIIYFPSDSNISVSNNTTVIVNVKNTTLARDFGFNITITQPLSSGYIQFKINNTNNVVGVYPQ